MKTIKLRGKPRQLNYDDFFDKTDRLLKRIKRLKNSVHADSAQKSGQYIFEGEDIIYEGGAGTCVIVVLYDKDNARGAMIHIREPEDAYDKLKEAIDSMVKLESKDIICIMAGGAKGENKEGIKKWGAVIDVLNNYEEFITILEYTGIDDGFRYKYINFIALWISNGFFEYAITDMGKSRGCIGEFYLKSGRKS